MKLLKLSVPLRRIAAVTATALVLLAGLLFAACGGDDSTKTSATAAPDNKATPTQAAVKEPTVAPTAAVSSGPTTANGGKAVAVPQWTTNLCTSVTTWLADIEKLDPTADVNKAKDADAVKVIMVKFLNDASTRTAKMQRDMGVDYPQVKDGAAIHAAFVAGAAQAVALFAAAAKDASTLDAKDPAKFGDNLSKLGTAISNAGDDLEQVFSSIDTKYDTVEISKVATGLPACKGIF